MNSRRVIVTDKNVKTELNINSSVHYFSRPFRIVLRAGTAIKIYLYKKIVLLAVDIFTKMTKNILILQLHVIVVLILRYQCDWRRNYCVMNRLALQNQSKKG